MFTCSFTRRRPSFSQNGVSQKSGPSHARQVQTACSAMADCPCLSRRTQRRKHSCIAGAARCLVPRSAGFSVHQDLLYHDSLLLNSGLYPEHLNMQVAYFADTSARSYLLACCPRKPVQRVCDHSRTRELAVQGSVSTFSPVRSTRFHQKTERRSASSRTTRPSNNTEQLVDRRVRQQPTQSVSL